MQFNRLTLMLATAAAPVLWGTTYLVFTQTLPVGHPLLVGALRALPAGVLLLLLGPGLPPDQLPDMVWASPDNSRYTVGLPRHWRRGRCGSHRLPAGRSGG